MLATRVLFFKDLSGAESEGLIYVENASNLSDCGRKDVLKFFGMKASGKNYC